MENELKIFNACDDADCLIVKTSFTKATEYGVTVVGRDTDVLVLLLYHF